MSKKRDIEKFLDEVCGDKDEANPKNTRWDKIFNEALEIFMEKGHTLDVAIRLVRKHYPKLYLRYAEYLNAR